MRQFRRVYDLEVNVSEDVQVEMSALEVGIINALVAISAALKASPGFNNEALKQIAQHMLDQKVPSPFRGPAAEEGYAKPLKVLISNQAPIMEWLGQDQPKH